MVGTGTEPVGAALMAGMRRVEGASGEAWWGAVVHTRSGDDFDGRPVHIGDTYSAEAAREVVQRLSFETGCTAVLGKSTARISHETGPVLANLADLATPETFCSLRSGFPARRSALS